MTSLIAWRRRASGLASAGGRPSISPGSGSRMVSTTAPAALSEPVTWASAAWIAAASKPARRMSLVPTMTLATSGPSSRARGSCARSTSAVRAPLAARLTRCPPGRLCARSAAQPRQPPPGAGSPTPSVIESPSAAKVVIALPFRGARGVQDFCVVADQLVAEDRPGPACYLLSRGAPHRGAHRRVAHQPRYGFGQRSRLARGHEKTGRAFADDVQRPARRRSDDRQPAGRCLLQRLPERLACPAVHEDVQAGVDPGEVGAVPGSEERRPRQGPAQRRLGGPVPHDHQPGPGQRRDLPEQVDPLLRGQPPDVPDEHLAAGSELAAQPLVPPGRV